MGKAGMTTEDGPVLPRFQCRVPGRSSEVGRRERHNDVMMPGIEYGQTQH